MNSRIPLNMPKLSGVRRREYEHLDVRVNAYIPEPFEFAVGGWLCSQQLTEENLEREMGDAGGREGLRVDIALRAQLIAVRMMNEPLPKSDLIELLKAQGLPYDHLEEA